MQFSAAFDVGRALDHGFKALKRFPVPLMLGGALMSVLDGGCNGGSNYSGMGGEGESFDWDALEGLIPDDGGASLWADLVQVAGPQLGLGTSLSSAFPELEGMSVGIIALIALVVLAFVSVFILLFMGIRAWLTVGWIRVHRDTLVTGEPEVARLFSGADKVLSAFGLHLLLTFIGLGTSVVAVLPGGLVALAGLYSKSMALGIVGLIVGLVCLFAANIYVQLGLALGMHGVVLDDRSALEAVQHSWELASGNRVSLLVFTFVMGLAQMIATVVGLLMLCVGALVTIPAMRAISDFGFTESYLLYTRDPTEREGWVGLEALAA